jgi:hypothetical protein
VYELKYSGSADSLCITLSRLDYARQSFRVSAKSQTLNIAASREYTVLKTAVVKPTSVRRYGDTIDYAVQSFKSASDRTVADVLRNIPGIDVSQSGRISYGGVPINKFYVENMDLMGGKYGVVTNNLNASHVETVQVYENHEPIKALRDYNISDRAAINLKLKEKSKAVWLITAGLGAGFSPLLWNNELSAMQFAKKSQTALMFKNNNTGDNVRMELMIHYGVFSTQQESSLLSIPSSTPNIHKSGRYLFNNVNMLTLNRLWKIDGDCDIRLNMDYSNDRQRRSVLSSTEYFRENEANIKIEERSEVYENIDNAGLMLSIRANRSDYFLTNTLSAKYDWSYLDADINGNAQYLKNPYLRVSNNFHWLKASRKLRPEIISNSSYSVEPRSLSLRPGLYDRLFNNGAPYELLLQNANMKTFTSTNSISVSRTISKVKTGLTGGFKSTVQRLVSDLGVPARTPADSMTNDLSFGQHKIYAEARLTYNIRRLTADLRLPAGIMLTNAKNIRSGKEETNVQQFFNPSLGLRYKIGFDWEASLSGSYNDYYDDVFNYYQGLIMTNYRTINRNSGQFAHYSTQAFSASIRYNEPIRLMNALISASYSRNTSDFMTERDFDGILSLTRNVDIRNVYENKQIAFSVSKGFDRVVKKINLSANYSNSSYNQLQQGQIVRSYSDGYGANMAVNLKPASWYQCSYNLRYSLSKTRMDYENAIEQKPVQRLTQGFNLDIFILKNLQFNARADHDKIYADIDYPSTFFMDVKITYKLSKTSFELALNNIFDKRVYSHTNLSAFYSMSSTYELRARSLIAGVKFSF